MRSALIPLVKESFGYCRDTFNSLSLDKERVRERFFGDFQGGYESSYSLPQFVLGEGWGGGRCGSESL
jgi:hypothetical protein